MAWGKFNQALGSLFVCFSGGQTIKILNNMTLLSSVLVRRE